MPARHWLGAAGDQTSRFLPLSRVLILVYIGAGEKTSNDQVGQLMVSALKESKAGAGAWDNPGRRHPSSAGGPKGLLRNKDLNELRGSQAIWGKNSLHRIVLMK